MTLCFSSVVLEERSGGRTTKSSSDPALLASDRLATLSLLLLAVGGGRPDLICCLLEHLRPSDLRKILVVVHLYQPELFLRTTGDLLKCCATHVVI